jgi:hypothetical protein
MEEVCAPENDGLYPEITNEWQLFLCQRRLNNRGFLNLLVCCTPSFYISHVRMICVHASELFQSQGT